jgi:16S rRNA G966 N2-methylase RsmD
LPKPSHLVDTYCGSGLFGITLSDQFEKVAGVEISSDSIKAAKVNAEMNGLGEKTEWLCGKAEDIFGGLAEKGFEGGKSCVVVDVSYHSPIPLYRPHKSYDDRSLYLTPHNQSNSSMLSNDHFSHPT